MSSATPTGNFRTTLLTSTQADGDQKSAVVLNGKTSVGTRVSIPQESPKIAFASRPADPSNSDTKSRSIFSRIAVKLEIGGYQWQSPERLKGALTAAFKDAGLGSPTEAQLKEFAEVCSARTARDLIDAADQFATSQRLQMRKSGNDTDHAHRSVFGAERKAGSPPNNAELAQSLQNAAAASSQLAPSARKVRPQHDLQQGLYRTQPGSLAAMANASQGLARSIVDNVIAGAIDGLKRNGYATYDALLLDLLIVECLEDLKKEIPPGSSASSEPNASMLSFAHNHASLKALGSKGRTDSGDLHMME